MKRQPEFLVVCSALALLASSGTAQGLAIGVKEIEIIQNTNNYLSLAEVQAFENGTGINKALSTQGGIASQTTTDFGGTADRAIDGNTNGDYFAANSVSHNANQTAGELWEVMLASPTNLDAVTIFGRTDCCQDRDNNLTLVLRDAAGAEIFRQNFGIPDNQSITIAVTGGAQLPEPATALMLMVAGAACVTRRRLSA